MIIRRKIRKDWIIGFVEGGVEPLFGTEKLKVHWVKNIYSDRWFADPFILDVDDKYIYVLAEECRYHKRGRIAKLTIDKVSYKMLSMDIILHEKTHLSFPNIIRHEGKVYVYPENCHSKKLDIYEYSEKDEQLIPVQTICNDGLWDSTITDYFGKWQLFGGRENHFCLEEYDWSESQMRFIHSRTYESAQADFRLAGQFFKYQGEVYCPMQDCSKTYGGAVIVNKVSKTEDGIRFTPVRRIVSPSKRMNEGMHTLNMYKGLVVIDAKGYKNMFDYLLFALLHLFKIR